MFYDDATGSGPNRNCPFGPWLDQARGPVRPLPRSSLPQSSNRHEAGRVFPLSEFFLEFATLIDLDHAVLRHADGHALPWPRGRSFEVDARDVKAGTVTGAFELPLPLQPVRRAAQVGAHGQQRVDDVFALVLVVHQ